MLMLAAALLRHIGNLPIQYLQQRLLHASPTSRVIEVLVLLGILSISSINDALLVLLERHRPPLAAI